MLPWLMHHSFPRQQFGLLKGLEQAVLVMQVNDSADAHYICAKHLPLLPGVVTSCEFCRLFSRSVRTTLSSLSLLLQAVIRGAALSSGEKFISSLQTLLQLGLVCEMLHRPDEGYQKGAGPSHGQLCM